MEQYRVVDTPNGPVTYLLARKRVKNLNLRIDQQGQVALSVPLRCPPERADAFVRDKSGWICSHLHRGEEGPPLLPEPDRRECRALLEEAVDRVYPLVAGTGVSRPEVKLRKMRSQWGNCHWRQGYITLNTALAHCPEPLRDYVALHELVHFLHPNHGPGFYAAMDARMPDWRSRRKELQRYGAALVSPEEKEA